MATFTFINRVGPIPFHVKGSEDARLQELQWEYGHLTYTVEPTLERRLEKLLHERLLYIHMPFVVQIIENEIESLRIQLTHTAKQRHDIKEEMSRLSERMKGRRQQMYRGALPVVKQDD